MGLDPFQTEADALDEINWYHAIRTEQTGLRWGITEHATPDIIGSCGFLNRSSRHQRAELGFELSPAHWAKDWHKKPFGPYLHMVLMNGT